MAEPDKGVIGEQMLGKFESATKRASECEEERGSVMLGDGPGEWNGRRSIPLFPLSGRCATWNVAAREAGSGDDF